MAAATAVAAPRSPRQRSRPRDARHHPTRELAQQIDEVASKIADVTGHVAVTVVGGVSYKPQTAALKYGCDILVATPGRLVDLIEQAPAT